MTETTDNIRRDAPGLARIAASGWLHSAAWALGASIDVGRLALGALLGEQRAEASGEPATAETEKPAANGSSAEALRERGAALLRRSADVDLDDDSHPAYARILGDLAPDEGRILRLLALEGPQAAVDVRSGMPFASQLVALGMSMIGAESGCRHTDRVRAYLNNLNRLGLIWFSREPLEDPLGYQVLEAQPEVEEAMKGAGRMPRTVRRSIHLTPFGEDFCSVCLPLDTAEFTAVVTEEPATPEPPPPETKMPAGPLSSDDSDSA
jgi:Abortive infection alpha